MRINGRNAAERLCLSTPPVAIETEKKASSLLPPDAPGRADYEAARARFEAALKEE